MQPRKLFSKIKWIRKNTLYDMLRELRHVLHKAQFTSKGAGSDATN